MITIACVYKSGPKFDISYVDKMYNRLKDICDCSFKFVCLTDSKEAIEKREYKTQPLKFNLGGWWSKMELFDSRIFDTNYVLYFDLDTLFIGNIYEIIKVAQEHDFLMLRGFNVLTLAKGDVAASGIMSWKVGSETPNKIYKAFFKNPLENIEETKKNSGGPGLEGDQGYIGNLLGWKNIRKFQEYLPKNYIVGKRDVIKSNIQDYSNVRIIAWSGNPTLRQMEKEVRYKEWINKVWYV